jgi:hypothetical protein
MWGTFIATAVAASVCLGIVNLASQLDKIRAAQHAASTAPSGPIRDGSPVQLTIKNQKSGHFAAGT